MSTYEISKSSLLSLKAEILRKQEEVSKIKLENKEKLIQKKPNPLDLKNDKKKANATGAAYEYNSEDEDLIRKSRSTLEAKAKLYDKLVKSGNPDNGEPNRYLVCFDQKTSKVPNYVESESEEEEFQDYEPVLNAEDEWVEYTDCLGRSRKCLKKDLEYLKEKDAELKESVDKKRLMQCEIVKEPEETIEKDDKEIELEPESELMSSDMRREELRKKWEKEEEEIAKKENVHYQDILFGEARTHGVGYYGFSKDDEVRAQQQEALRKLRQETQEQQKKAQDLRAMREKQLAMRAKAARNRKRARMGLPPEEDPPEALSSQKQETTAENESQEKQSEEERLKEEARKKHIRPWDIGKDGLKKEFYEYSQEEWVDKQRKERVAEFAPPSSYIEEKESRKGHSKEERRKPKSYKNQENSSDDDASDNLLQDYKFISSQNLYTKPSTATSKAEVKVHMQPKRIINELSESEEEEDTSKLRNLNPYKNYAAIPPPSNLENNSDSSKPKKTKLNTEESIMAGLQFLRKQAEKKSSSSGHEREMFLM